MDEGRGVGFWLLVAAWIILLVPAAALAAYVAAPPAWKAALGLPPPPTVALAVARGHLPPLSEALQSGEVAETRPAWQRHRQPPPAVAASTPLIALVVTGLGPDEALLAEAEALPGGVTLSFSPYARPFAPAMDRAMAEGHELMLDLPMEGGEGLDLGPQALLTLLDRERNLRRLGWLLDGPDAAAAPVVGVVTLGGEAFLAAGDLAGPVLAELAARGLIFLDAVGGDGAGAAAPTTAGLPRLAVDRLVGGDAAAVAHQLAELERVALLQGSALGVARADAATMARLAPWLASLDERGYVLAPLSAVLERRAAASGP